MPSSIIIDQGDDDAAASRCDHNAKTTRNAEKRRVDKITRTRLFVCMLILVAVSDITILYPVKRQLSRQILSISHNPME